LREDGTSEVGDAVVNVDAVEQVAAVALTIPAMPQPI
jgi:ribulose-5-phosphate 4-epimerase/fuculose-1-phosphate aldolase